LKFIRDRHEREPLGRFAAYRCFRRASTIAAFAQQYLFGPKCKGLPDC